MNPKKFKPKRDSTQAALRKAALLRLRQYWELNKEEDEEWQPESEPQVRAMLESVEGGIEHCIHTLRFHEDDDAKAFLEAYDAMPKTVRQVLSVEEIAHAAGIGSLRLTEIVQTALFLYGDRQTQMILSAAMPKVIRSTIKAATDEVPIVADVAGKKLIVGHTNGDMKAAEMLLKARNVLPIPKGAQIAIQVNQQEKEEQPSQHGWKWPEDRLKDITQVLNPKQLEASKSTDKIHFDHRQPVVIER
jgi:hypothetical protein